MDFAYFKILLVLLTVSLFFSCSENKTGEIKESDNTYSQTQNIETEKPENKPTLIEAEKLTEFLPAAVPGTEKTPYKTGSIDEDELRVSIASCEFVFPNHGFLKFSINDYGSKKFHSRLRIAIVFLSANRIRQRNRGVYYHRWKRICLMG